ncbi:iron chelate uptake ABC transporter family permease subunit, partial [Mycobacterium tuberculosis]|nr:iron chelate uptake ABC transporter family permease subunit [Mycobacterium tuberculosis]
VLLLLAACLTAAATLTIGPLSFVGLMAPHIARMMGFRRTLPHMVISGLTGGLLLVFADWCGRMMMFPYQIPAGLLWRAAHDSVTQSMNVAADKQYDPENRGHPSCHIAPVSAGWRLRLIRPTVRAACL